MSSNNSIISMNRVGKRYFKQGQRTLKELVHAVLVRKDKPGQFIWALKDISFKIKKGEAVGVIGKNGAGKSTLLKLMAGVTTPTNGSLKIKGKIAPLIELGAGFHPELTGKENIFLNGAILGMTKQEVQSKISQIIAFSELEEFIDSPVKFYSSGMYLRLAFSVAIHVDADILLIDEILAVGDENFQKKCLKRLEDLKESGATIIFVSHNIHSIRDYCERAIYLEEGKIRIDSTAEKSITKYTKDMEKES